MGKNKVVSGRGERLLRLTSNKGRQRKDATSFSSCYGGAEANVLMSLSSLGRKTRFLTRLGKDEISLGALLALKKAGVDPSFIKRDDNPLGLYFLEEGEGKRPSKVVYHRKGSSATARKKDDFDFDEALKDVALFHVSGISLCLSESRRECVREARKACKKRNIPVSFDFNYRSTLLPLEDAKKIYPLVVPYCKYIFASLWDRKTLLGFRPFEENEDEVFQKACMEFGFDFIFTKKRSIINDRNQLLLPLAYTEKEKIVGRQEERYIFDRIGAGDSFAAGVLFGLLEKKELKESLDYGIANCALKQTIFGDQANFSKEELEEYLRRGKEERKR